jgi:hypothetical protein
MGEADKKSSTLDVDCYPVFRDGVISDAQVAKVRKYFAALATRTETDACAEIARAAKRLIESYARLTEMRPLLPRHRKLLLRMPGFSPRLHAAMKAEISGSVRKHDRRVKHVEAMALRQLVDKVEARMRENGERLSGIRDAALDEVAEQQGLSSGETLRRMLDRYK